MTLTETAVLTKRVLLLSAIGLVVIITTWLGYRWYQAYLLSKIPPVVEQATTEFGKLPKPKLPVNQLSATNYSYTLETETGNLPQFSHLVKVYFIPQLGTTLLAPERAKRLADTFGFSNGPEVLSPTEYLFKNDKGDSFLMNIDSGNFKYGRTVSTSSAIRTLDVLADEAAITEEFRRFLSNKGVFKDGIRAGRVQVYYDNRSQKESTTAAVTLWQDDIVDGESSYQIVTNDYKRGLINAIVNKVEVVFADDEIEKYPNLEYVLWPVEVTKFSTYPLKEVPKAYEDLQAGKASIVLEPTKNTVGITSVRLAYYLTKDYTPYLIPIYIFEGENFAAYVQALTDEYLEEQ